ncbi:hypothetical protein Tco_0166271, partial [Tanacetum coccineum]
STYTYCFKAIILEDTTSASLTCFTPETKGLPMHECEQLFQKVKSKDPLEITVELKALDGTKHKTRTSCQSVGTRELSVAPANVAISAIFDLPKAGVLQSVPAVSTTKVPEMSTPPKTVEFKSVPRIMKSIDAPVKVCQKIAF